MVDENPTIDILNRGKYIKTVMSIINSESAHKNGCSFAIEGQWGIGKTFVLDAIADELLKEKYYIFRYDCWAYDYYKEPLVALLASITDQINIDDSSIHKLVKKTKKCAATLLAENISSIGGAIGALLAGPSGAAVGQSIGAGISQTKKAIDKANKEDDEEIKKSHSYDAQFSLRIYLQQLQILLETIAKEKKIVFLIDELDRCLPTYQIKVLERIHHLTGLASLYPNDEKHRSDPYALSKSIIVYAVNRKQLEHTIQCIYGDDVKYYLKKFIDFSLALDEGELSNDQMAEKYKKDMEAFLPSRKSRLGRINWTEMLEKYLFQGLDIRTQEKLWEKRRIIHDKIFTSKESPLPQIYLTAELMLLAMNEWRNRVKSFVDIVSMSKDNLGEIMLLGYNAKGSQDLTNKKDDVIKFFNELTNGVKQFAKSEYNTSTRQDGWTIIPRYITDEVLLMAVWIAAVNNRYIKIKFPRDDDKDAETAFSAEESNNFITKMKNFSDVIKILVD